MLHEGSVTLTNPPRTIAYQDSHPSSSSSTSTASVFLFLHGFLDNCASFGPLQAELRRQLSDDDDARFILVDFAGHGKSSHGTRHSYSVADAALDVADLLKSLAVRGRVAIVGHSFGGGVAALLGAALGPQIVERVILLDSLGPYAGPAHDFPRLLHEAVHFAAAVSQPHASLRAAAEHRAKKNFVGSMHLDDALLLAERGTVPAPSAAQPEAVVWNYDPLLKRSSPHRITPEQTAALFAELRVPMLVLMAADGLFGALFTPVGRLLTQFGALSSLLGWLLGSLLWLVRELGLRHRLGALVGKLETAAIFAARVRALRRAPHVQLETIAVRGGGHHVHMRFAKLVADSIRVFLAQKSKPNTKKQD